MTEAPATAPRVSAIITVYNNGAYVGRAIDSLLTQTFADLEVIVINDGSSDNTADVIDNYARREPRVRALHQGNTGQSAARNRAIAASRGEYLAVLDSDDVAVPDRLEKQVAYLDAHPSVGAVSGCMLMMDQGEHKHPGIYRYPTRPWDVRWWMFRVPTVNHPAATLRRSVVEKIGGYRTAFDVVADVDLFLRISDHAELATLPDVFVYCRSHPNRITAKHHPRQMVMNRVAIELAHSRVRGNRDEIPEGLFINAATIDRLGLDADQLDRLRPLFAEG